MSNPVAIVRNEVKSFEDRTPIRKNLMFWCPGCDEVHRITFEQAPDATGPVWQWDGNLEAPTVSPSILTRWYGYPRGVDPAPGEVQRPAEQVCHSFLRSGRWEFLSDSTHRLSGQSVDMVPLPDWLAGEASS